MPNPNFKVRAVCEVCGDTAPTCLASVPFLDPRIRDFLQGYYGGKIPTDLLGEADFEVLECPRCGFMWQKFVLNDDCMEQLYDRWISPELSLHNKSQADLSLFSSNAREVYLIAHLLQRKPYQISVLDFGMGWGYWCLMAKAFGYQVTGLELSETRIALARQNNIRVIHPDQLNGEQFDFISADQVFEHLDQPLNHLKRLARALKPEGMVRLAVPDANRDKGKFASAHWKADKDAFHPLEHINSFTHASLVFMARQAGLEPISTIPYILMEPRSLKSILKIFAPYRLRSTRLYFRAIRT